MAEASDKTPSTTPKQVHELDDACYNVAFNRGEHTHLHLGMQVTFEKAKDYVSRFTNEYVGKPYPNGKGLYPFTNPRVVIVIPRPTQQMTGLTIAALQHAHVERQEEWCPDQKPDLSFRGNELGGECGEAQNVIKKLERERYGWRGSRDTIEHLGEELADVIHCACLVAVTAGIDIEAAVVAKFNSTSEKNGLSTFLADPTPAPQMMGQDHHD